MHRQTAKKGTRTTLHVLPRTELPLLAVAQLRCRLSISTVVSQLETHSAHFKKYNVKITYLHFCAYHDGRVLQKNT